MTSGSKDDEEGRAGVASLFIQLFFYCLFTSLLFLAAMIPLYEWTFFKIVVETASDVRLDGDEGAGRVRVQSLELSLIQAC